MNIGRILAVARNGFQEVLRDKILYIVGLFVIILILGAILLPPISVGADQKIFLDLGINAISLIGAIVAIFVGTGLINKEIEKKTVLVLIPKPVARAEFIIGKHLGLSAVIFVLLSTMTVFYLILLSTLKIPYNLGSILVAVAFILLELALLVAVAMTFGVFTSSILATLFSFGVYIMGHLSRDLLQLGKITDNPGVKQITRLLYAIVPDLERLNLKNGAVYNILPPTGELFSALVYALLYIVFLLSITILIFSRRQF